MLEKLRTGSHSTKHITGNEDSKISNSPSKTLNLKLNSPKFFQNHPEKATFEKKVQNTCSFGSKMSFLNNQQDSNDRSNHGTPEKPRLPRSGTGKFEA